MKVALKSKNWVEGRIRVYGIKQTIYADSAEGAVTLVYERDPRNPQSYTFKGIERTRQNPDSKFARDLPPIVEHLPWDAVSRTTSQRALAVEQQRRSYHD